MGKRANKDDGKAPAFQLYAAEFLADENVRAMSLAERGAYITLMCFCWREGSITVVVSLLARLCDSTADEFAPIWEGVKARFVPHAEDPTRLIHLRLEKERRKQAAWRKKSSDGGKKGANIRWKHNLRNIGVVKAPLQGSSDDGDSGGVALQSSSSSSSSFPLSPPRGGGRKRRSDVRREEVLAEALK
jgi:uncharacterized protein YdaU (DUF1376 family)